MTSDVLIRREGAVGRISLDRAKALHALTTAMCEAISAALLEWCEDPSVEAVILDHHQGRGFCAGGDVAMVRRSALEDGGAAGRAFFHAEYRMNQIGRATSELQSRENLVCRLLLEKKKAE